MKAAQFEYKRARSVEDATALLASLNGEGRLLAGGQTLGPMLNMRLARPQCLVDIGHIDALKRVEHQGAELVVGACVTHATLEDQVDPSPAARLLAHVAGSIAYRAVRNRGTIGGSLAHADPAADWIAVCTLLNATVHISGPGGRRVVGAASFMKRAFATAIQGNEVLVAVAFDQLSESTRWGYCRIQRKIGEFPEAIGAVALDGESGRCRVVVGAIDGPPVVLASLADDMRSRAPALPRIQEVLRARLPESDAIDLHLHAVAVKRACEQALAA